MGGVWAGDLGVCWGVAVEECLGRVWDVEGDEGGAGYEVDSCCEIEMMELGYTTSPDGVLYIQVFPIC